MLGHGAKQDGPGGPDLLAPFFRGWGTQWLTRAEAAAAAAKILLAHQPLLGEMIRFRAQQAAEKLIKAFLVHHQIEFPMTRHLGRLPDLADQVDPQLSVSPADCAALNSYGVAERTPGPSRPMARSDADRLPDLARRVRDAVLGRLQGRA